MKRHQSSGNNTRMASQPAEPDNRVPELSSAASSRSARAGTDVPRRQIAHRTGSCTSQQQRQDLDPHVNTPSTRQTILAKTSGIHGDQPPYQSPRHPPTRPTTATASRLHTSVHLSGHPHPHPQSIRSHPRRLTTPLTSQLCFQAAAGPVRNVADDTFGVCQ